MTPPPLPHPRAAAWLLLLLLSLPAGAAAPPAPAQGWKEAVASADESPRAKPAPPSPAPGKSDAGRREGAVPRPVGTGGWEEAKEGGETPEPGGPDATEPEPDAAEPPEDTRTLAEILDLQPGEWKMNLEMGSEIFPSWILGTAGMKSDEPNDPGRIGDPFGVIGVAVRSPRDSCPVELSLESGRTIRRSALTATLERSGEVYLLHPTLDFDYDTLASVTQPFPETLRATLRLGGGAAQERLERVTVRSVNDCVLGFYREDGEAEQVDWTFAAYVNENHPAIHDIMARAVDREGKPMSFSAYQGDKGDVLAEIRSIWNELKRRKLRYSSIRTSSLATQTVETQHVRRPGETLRAIQANCVDGTVLLASILRKMELDVYLVSVPGHMLLAVRLEMPAETEEGEEAEDGEDAETEGDATEEEGIDLAALTFVETTRLGDGSLDDAIKDGMAALEEHRAGLLKSLDAEDGIADDCSIVSVEAARSVGVLPIREPEAK